MKYFLPFIFVLSTIFAQQECDNGRYNTEIFTDVNVTSGIFYGSNINSSIFGDVIEDLYLDFYEPIKELSEGEFSKIVMIPGGYIIWYLESIIEGEGNVREVKQIFIEAKTIEDFFRDYLAGVNINKIY